MLVGGQVAPPARERDHMQHMQVGDWGDMQAVRGAY